MRALRILRRTSYTTLALILAFFLTIQFQQHLLRHRAEKLHAEILALQLHPGTFADIQRMQKEWGRFAHYEGECTAHHCIYKISLPNLADSTEGRSTWIEYHWRIREYISQPYSWVGGRSENVSAEVRVRDDVMWGADFSLLLAEVPAHPGSFDDPDQIVLSVEIRYGPRLFSRYPQYSGTALRRGYTIGVLRGVFAFINITPRTGQDAMHRLTAINFACITRYHQCSEPVELIPNLWEEYATQSANRDALPNSQAVSEADYSDCTPPLSLLALEAKNIVLVQFEGRNDLKDDVSGFVGSYDLLRPLRYFKNGSEEEQARVTELAIRANPLQQDRAVARRGERFFLVYSRSGRDPSRPRVEQCAVFSDTPEHEREILKGIAMDPSVGEPYSWTG